MERLSCTSILWRWQGDGGASWYFLRIDGEAGEALAATALIRRLETGRTRGFGSLRVAARIGDTAWRTSVFPQKEGGWLLPVKAQVRRAEALDEGDAVELAIEIEP